MPSFDVVCELDNHEVSNAVDQSNREVATRFDFKGCSAEFEQVKEGVKLQAETEFQLQQMVQILRAKLTKRQVDLGHLEEQAPTLQHNKAEQLILLKQGISTEMAKKIVKLIKEKKLKVQAAIQGEQVRVTGKKRDDLQAVMAVLREAELSLPLQFNNFRD